MLGHTLAHYKILEKIGSRGMGDVYLAEDTKLDRNIALKVLPAELAESNERFEREAKAIAALNHPNIITVHSVEQADGVHFITMELVKGKTLAELLPKKGFPLEKFLDMAIPLADAVAAAHEEGMMPVWAPAGDEIIFTSERNGARSLYRMPVDGGEPKIISAIPASYARWSRDGQTLYWIEFGAASGNIWAVSPRTGTERRMTDLERKGGNLGTYGLAVTDTHLYFTWEEDRGDIWVMDVVTDETE